MIKVEKIETWGFEHAIRGMRNPMNSWEKSDTVCSNELITPSIGNNDLTLMKQLYYMGLSHRKYLRQIFISMDITAPLYWWKEFDTYKVGTTANSCSTMHKLLHKPFETSDFSLDHMTDSALCELNSIIEMLNIYRDLHLGYDEQKNHHYPQKEYWYSIIQLLPSSYNQKRTVTMNYENVMNILDCRSNHKLDEWRDFCKTLLQLPYMEEIRNGER